MNLTEWTRDVVGRYIDIDGWYGAQCWDLWADYAIRVHGAEKYSTWTSSNAGRDSGYASSVWLQFPAHPGLDRQFLKMSRHTPIRAGDVIVWARSPQFPDSHIAIATGAIGKGVIECVTQNDGTGRIPYGATRIGWITLGGMLGILRPRITVEPPVVEEPEQEEDDMAKNAGIYYLDGKTSVCAIVNTQTGFFSAWSTDKGDYNNALARAFDTPPFAEVTRKHFDEVRRACASMRGVTVSGSLDITNIDE